LQRLPKIHKTYIGSNPKMIWFLVGLSLCVLEAVVPTAFIALVAGVAAMIVGFASPWLLLSGQVLLWFGLTTVGVWLSRGLVKPQRQRQFDAATGETLTVIPIGAVGRVRYEGQSWPAHAADPNQEIPAATPVAVVGREGTMLVVSPIPSPF
jgi:membrane protein implicated in regulation of membrane protease activity